MGNMSRSKCEYSITYPRLWLDGSIRKVNARQNRSAVFRVAFYLAAVIANVLDPDTTFFPDFADNGIF